MKKLSIRPRLPPWSTELYIGRGILQEIYNSLQGRIVVVADPAAVSFAPLHSLLLPIVPHKSKEIVDQIHSALFASGCGRDTTIIALGGGTTCDVVGFAASTYMRGIPLILIPSTLLAMVDAAIGGKTAIDTSLGKNLIGSFYFPKAIIADLDLLDTLSEQEKMHGMAEVLKMGLIRDASIWQNEAVVEKAMIAKIQIIEEDPTELGLRRILNFGHTIGHGLEKIGQMPHGRAVALGCIAEAHLSMHLGFLPKEEFTQVLIPYQKFALSLPHNYTREKLMTSMQYDKKKKGGELRVVLIDRIGHVIPFGNAYCRAITKEELAPTLAWLEAHYG